jgi:arylsulfatase A-like enzyme
LNLKSYYGESIDYYRDGKDIDAKRASDDSILLTELESLPRATDARRPQMLMIGLMSVHIWGHRDDRFRRFLPDRISTSDFAKLDQNSTVSYRNNHHNGVLQADWILEQIWGWLARNGYLDDSIVVVTSDHGESLGENGLLGHARSLQTPELLITLWVYAPDSKVPKRSFAFQTDIGPTILDLLELPIPESWEGSSLLVAQRRTEWHPLYFINNRDQFGLIRHENGRVFKYLLDKKSQRERLYNLDVDLFEATDVIEDTPPEVVWEFRQRLRTEFGTLLAN